jgi:glycine/D-amino acid oxidase-like deaminating enzyme
MTSIVVIGGGIAGLSAAAYLAEDAHVVVLEAEDAPGYHASGRSAAVMARNYGSAPVRALNQASFPWLDANGYLGPRGLMMVAPADQETRFRKDAEEMELREIPREEALAKVPVLNPDRVAFAAHQTDVCDIDTDRLLQGFARSLRAQGGEVRTRAQVSSIAWRDRIWRVTAGEETWEAEYIVNAAGAWADDVARMAGVPPLGIVPHRRSVARIPAPPGMDVARWPMLFGVGESWYAKPDAGALIVSPADEDRVAPHDAWPEDMVLATGLARYEAMVTEPVTRLLPSWAGLRSFAPDRSLVLGPDPRMPSFVWCAGQGGYGMQTSPAAGALTSALVFGRRPAIATEAVHALTPDRLV